MKRLEDFSPGETMTFRAEPVSAEEIKAFAREWDPQRLHLDDDYATAMHGGLIASGFQTLVRVFRPIVDGLLGKVDNIGGLGMDDIRWPHPVRPDEALDIRLDILSVTPSRSKPDRGVVSYLIEATNPAGQTVMTMRTATMVKRRDGAEQ